MKSLQFFFSISVLATIRGQKVDPVEPLFRRTLAEYRRKVNSDPSTQWAPWREFPALLASLVDDAPLQVVGGYEEAILVIEQASIAAGAGEDANRDLALSNLYFGYAKMLASLNADLCTKLALSPHNLLIGAETADANSPSTKLCVENAENSLRNAASLDATNNEAEELLKEISGQSAHERKPKEFIAELFDSFADTFDEKLLGTLGYKVPSLVGQAAKDLRIGKSPPTFETALDAGCGTGLAGRYLRPLVQGPMVGVDASQKMLDVASKCTTTSGCGLKSDSDDEAKEQSIPLYDGLFALDLEDMTLSNTLKGASSIHRSSPMNKFDLVVAADVLVYFGQLNELFQTFADLSTTNAGLIFSCERASEEEAPLGWRLLASGRFAHTKKHAVKAAEKAGYKLIQYEEIVPRMEKGEEVRGHLFSFVLKSGERKEDNGKVEL